jgi:hypothetical protein
MNRDNLIPQQGKHSTTESLPFYKRIITDYELGVQITVRIERVLSLKTLHSNKLLLMMGDKRHTPSGTAVTGVCTRKS